MGKVYHIYCDESRQTKDRFMVLGGILITQVFVSEFDATMLKFRAEQKMTAELKWKKVSPGKLNEYKRFIEYFFALNNSDKVHFHCMIIDNTQVDHSKFSGDKETGFYKFYYQLLLHCFGKKYLGKEGDAMFHVRLDYRQSSYSLDTLKTCLNSGMHKKFNVSTSPFKSVEPRDSHGCEIIQIADILLGAIGYEKNGYDLLAGANPAKNEMVKYITAQSGLKNLKDSTIRGKERFAIWNFRLQK